MKEAFQKNAQGLQLYYRSWPIEQPQANIVLIHGQGEHIGRYDHLAAWFNAKGFGVYGMDHLGHGKSDGRRGHTPNLQVLLHDIQALTTDVSAEWPQTPLFIYAHSMGGQLALNTALKGMLDQLHINGLVATGPWVRLAFEAPQLKVLAGKILKYIIPDLTLPTGIAANFVSRDPAVVTAYINDPLNHGKVSAAGGMALLEGANFLDKYMGRVPFPMLVMHGTADKLTSFAASKAFVARLSGDTTFKPWDGFYHEIHNEKEQNEVFEYTYAWMQAHM